MFDYHGINRTDSRSSIPGNWIHTDVSIIGNSLAFHCMQDQSGWRKDDKTMSVQTG